MKNYQLLLTGTALTLLAIPALAGDHGNHSNPLHECLKQASELQDGYYAKLEYLTMTEGGGNAYEIEIKDANGVEWEFICDIHHQEIIEIEREVESANDPLFKKHMKVDEKTASQTALELYPGKLVHTEYEIESNGAASYEFDIWSKPGVTYKVEVSASTGEIVEVNIEQWDIGREAGE